MQIRRQTRGNSAPYGKGRRGGGAYCAVVVGFGKGLLQKGIYAGIVSCVRVRYHSRRGRGRVCAKQPLQLSPGIAFHQCRFCAIRVGKIFLFAVQTGATQKQRGAVLEGKRKNCRFFRFYRRRKRTF